MKRNRYVFICAVFCVLILSLYFFDARGYLERWIYDDLSIEIKQEFTKATGRNAISIHQRLNDEVIAKNWKWTGAFNYMDEIEAVVKDNADIQDMNILEGYTIVYESRYGVDNAYIITTLSSKVKPPYQASDLNVVNVPISKTEKIAKVIGIIYRRAGVKIPECLSK